FRGGFSRDGRITPSSIRLEGLLAARSLFSDEYKELFGVDRSIKRGIQFLLKAQIKDGDYVGAFPRALRKIDGTSENVIKFNDRVTEIRIDYAQHALSAMIGYLNLLNNNNKVTQNN
ncbi:MAG: hypothetical protein GTN99_01400, partial [Candidatus Dadabacteria bacterium]|nr:hypothetical protein [Candidatus Dadabacteria bacterium]